MNRAYEFHVSFTKNKKHMLLSEALSIRADLQKRLASLKGRLKNNLKIQEGDIPTEAPEALFEELGQGLARLEDLIYRINATNMQTLHKGEPLTKSIAARDALALRVSTIREVLNYVSERETRYGREEIKYIRTMDVGVLQKDLDTYAQKLRELDLEIQALNWATNLV